MLSGIAEQVEIGPMLWLKYQFPFAVSLCVSGNPSGSLAENIEQARSPRARRVQQSPSPSRKERLGTFDSSYIGDRRKPGYVSLVELYLWLLIEFSRKGGETSSLSRLNSNKEEKHVR